jgi:hypothetical protein
VPSPIFVAAIIGVEKLLRIDLDATQGPVSLVRQVLDRLPEGASVTVICIEIYRVNLEPTIGGKQQGNARPCLILSITAFNKARTIGVVPLSSSPVPFHR